MGVTKAVIGVIKGITQNWLVQNVIGELAGDLVEKAIDAVSGAVKDHKYARAVREKIDAFLSIDGAEAFLEAAAQRRPQPAHKTWARPASDADIGKSLAEYVKSDATYTGSSVWKAEIVTIPASEEVKEGFFDLLVSIQEAAGKYWESMLDKPNAAVVYLVTRNVAKQNDALFAKIEESFSKYLFGGNVSAPALNLLKCENCGAALNPANGKRTESGLYAFVCPSCGTPHAGGNFSSDGAWAKWSKDLKDLQTEMRSGFEKTWSKLDDILQDTNEIRSVSYQTNDLLMSIKELVLEQCSRNNQHENPQVKDFLDAGDEARQGAEFDKAIEFYQQALELDPNSAVAHFGLALAEYKIFYLPVFKGANMIRVPVCYDPDIYLSKIFYENPHYKKALEIADMEASYEDSTKKKEFIRIADRIDATREIFKSEHKKGFNIGRNKQQYGFDVFFCVKVTETDGSGKKTRDREEAIKLYKSLRKKYRIFYSESEEGRKFLKEGNRDPDGYNARLTYALYSSKCILVICGNEGYLKTDYVKNEYTLFAYMIKQGYKPKGSIQIYSTSTYPVVDTLPGIGQFQVIVPDTEKKTLKEIREFIDQFKGEKQVVNAPQPPKPQPSKPVKPIKVQPSESARVKASDVETFITHVMVYGWMLILLTLLYALLFHFAPLNSLSVTLQLTAKICGYVLGALSLIFALILMISQKARCIKVRLLEGMRIALSVLLGLTILAAGLIWIAPIGHKVENYDKSQFQIEGTVLKEYFGNETVVTIPAGVTSIDSFAFDGCHSVTEVTIPVGVASIGHSAFSRCDSLQKVTIPAGVTTIGERAFWHCRSLKEITIPASVTSIGGSAFWGCDSLTEITIPASVMSIGTSAFNGCDALGKITVDERNQVYRSENNCIIERKTNTLIVGCNASVIPAGVTSIGNSAFWGCSSLKAVTIPAGVTSFGDHAFSLCSSLKEITIPADVTSVGKNAFSSCNQLTIYCEAKEKPAGWAAKWNPDNRPVVWNCKA